MRATHVVGPVAGRFYQALDTGERWNGAPVLAFTLDQMHALIAAGDGSDSNGYGLAIDTGQVLDVTGPCEHEPVPTIPAEVRGDAIVLYVPAGRVWEETSANSTVAGIGYDADGRCRACGEHIGAPHAPECPAAVAAGLREEAEANDQAHGATLAVGGYTSGACPTLTGGDEPAEVSHRFVASAQRLAADLIEMDHAEAINLDAWPAAAEFVAYVTGEANQWRT